MNKLIAVLILGLLFIAPTNLKSQDIPSSPRSKRAIEKVKPNLQIEFEKSGFSLGLPIFMRIFKEEKN